jgi:hypothetical protein
MSNGMWISGLVGLIIGISAILAWKHVIQPAREHIWDRVCYGYHGGVTPKYRAKWWVTTCWAFWIGCFVVAYPAQGIKTLQEARSEK